MNRPATYDKTLTEEVVDDLLRSIKAEFMAAIASHAPMRSAHEGLAVIEEEVHELKLEVYKRQSQRSLGDMENEARQVAAMGLRFMVDVCGAGRRGDGDWPGARK